MNLNDGVQLAEFFDREDVIAKFQAVHNLERQSWYEYARDPGYWQRALRTIETIPPRFRDAAFALFANVIYIGSDLLEEALRHLAREVSEKAHDLGYTVPTDVHVFTVDHPGLVDDFFRVGGRYGWTGRLDDQSQRSVRSASELLHRLEEAPEAPADDLAIINGVFQKPLWLLLADNALSGGSAKSDLDKLSLIGELLPGSTPPMIMLAAQILTKQAEETLCTRDDLAWLTFGILLSNNSRVNHESCDLFSSLETLHAVRELCRWFGDMYFPVQIPLVDARGRRIAAVDDEMTETLKIHRSKGGDPNFAYGWSDGGYTLVTHKNCPSNSVPLLWYPMITSPTLLFDYKAPFPRNPSRRRQITAQDPARITRVSEKLEQIRGALYFSHAN